MTTSAPSTEPPIRAAMVLAAGLGLRMRPITDSLPKPLVRVGGRSLLDHALDRLEAAGIEEAVVNTHHFAELVEGHLQPRTSPKVRVSREEALLETGGGVALAARRYPDLLGSGPFYVVNGDALWLDGSTSALRRLARAWDGTRMDALLLLHPTVSAYGYRGAGDFTMDQRGRIRRRKAQEIAPFLFTGVQILSPRLFTDLPDRPFSLNVLYDRALDAERLFGIRHEGVFYHVGTPQDLDTALRTFEMPELRSPFF